MRQDPDGDPDLDRDGRRNGDFEPRPDQGPGLWRALALAHLQRRFAEHDAPALLGVVPRREPASADGLRAWLDGLPQPWAGAYAEIRRLDPAGERVTDAAFLRTIAPTHLLKHYDRIDREKETLGYVEIPDLRGRPMHPLARFPHVLRYAEAIGVAIRWRQPCDLDQT